LYLAVLAAGLLPALSASAETAAEKHVAQQIGVHLKQSGQLHNYKVQVKFHDGVAYLAGSVASGEQRDTAVRLAQQVEGVTHVACKLDCPSENESDAIKGESFANSDRQKLDAELDRTSFDGADNDASNVTHAFQSSGPPQQAAPMQQSPMQQNPSMQRQGVQNISQQTRRSNMPVPYQRMPGMMPMRQAGPGPSGIQQASCASCNGGGGGMGMGPGPGMAGPMCGPGGDGAPNGFVPNGSGRGPGYDSPQMPGYAWPSYASYPNYAALSYPQQYSPTAWPYIGPFYPYPQVPLAWRKVSLEWDDGWWFLDFSSHNSSH
jgi:hypothetical protein